MTPRNVKTTLWLIILVSLGIHVFCLIAGRSFMSGWLWPHEPFHACVEVGGGLIALLVATMLISLQHRESGTSFNPWIAGALVGMGVLDIFHAAVPVGKLFVWLHSTATLAGGVLFAMVWLPNRWMRQVTSWWPWVALLAVSAFGIFSLAFSDDIPVMVVAKKFTTTAKALNIAGGILLFLAAFRLILEFSRRGNVDDLLFCLHCSLFGAAAVMFEQSQLWDLPWWGWHLLRLMAYGVALWFVIRTELAVRQAFTDALQQTNEQLEERVAERTKQLTVLNESLVRSNHDLDEFAYIASHDLKEPLRGISSYSMFLLEDYGDQLDEDGREKLLTLPRLCKRLEDLINSLLQYSRVGRADLAIQSTNLNELIHEIVDSMHVTLQQEQVEIRTPRPLPRVKCDRVRVGEVFRNLITNAYKYNDNQLKWVEIGCQNGQPEGDPAGGAIKNESVFYVRDNGIGIRPKHLELIFGIFKRLHGRDKYGGGSGAGLTFVKKIVERHGGRIWVESEFGEGTTFYFTLGNQTLDERESWHE